LQEKGSHPALFLQRTRRGQDLRVTEPDALFVYGTLMFPEVLEVLLGRTPTMAPAALDGWRAAALTDRVYPGLVVAGPGLAAAGRVLLGLDERERAVLDAFEEDEVYERRPVVLADGREATTYVWIDDAAVLDHDWDPGLFVTEHLPTYVARWSTWRPSS
jgi:gamma-glutamylcyclotransferase (GGCT)/AIG2-like uncharacterized protein YtfP